MYNWIYIFIEYFNCPFYAAECGHVDICAALLDYGATLKRNEFDMTAVTTAAERTRELVVEMFYGRPGLLTKEEV